MQFSAVKFSFSRSFCLSYVFIVHMLHFEQKSKYGVEYPFNNGDQINDLIVIMSKKENGNEAVR